ncbi:tRNA (adenosine(37)-N6)-threonylcarbamoyltransferase complex dimerization subunit type 1 TsaB [Ornithinibacillus halophilus]|uniref:tRNA threonylcarbamoyladenosine biosynthesis protein TsaB n=1 Tax=Ornithinibacillus halophilus TaxID=930117 RepID=A0A1M5HGJ9_9BACI|nr:tRNA (adenosine(37)-N6)-threonylcarbamoyltransferase complex dimerization subunit type 1 TsaB [Ornithinibacillus halophilus]SHG15047.1 tRNA threonylcarbamoyladenosine biosynthesis protein TsaB [Ornithinibacillus halophilus]
MYILAMDTSNQSLGVAIMKGSEVLGELITNIPKNHSVRLMPAVDKLMREVNITPDQLEKIVVAKGPGSYTGVRIGLTTAKTLAWSLNIPIVGVSSLEVLAYQGRLTASALCPFFDARRGLVYTGLYEWNHSNSQMEQLKKETNMLMEDWLGILKDTGREILFLSPDMDKHREVILDILGEQVIFPSESIQIARPSDLALASMKKESDSTHGLTPNYLRLAEAESKWLQSQKEQKNNG